MWIVICRWEEFQHRDMARSTVPPWIKTYTKLMADDDFLNLSFHNRGLLISLWLEYALARRQLGGTTEVLSKRLGHTVKMRDLKALIDAGFIVIVASKPAGAHAGKVAGLEVEVEKEVKERPALPAKPERRRQLLTAATKFADDWNGGTSDAFDAGLDELEQLVGARLQAGDRYRLWDKALHHG